ncbi:MAG: hypothetical protein AAF211_27750 [Myxococcota bacterium]
MSCIILAIVWSGYRAYTGVALEDAWITFQHAENLASGSGYGFNPDTWVQGSTTPLMTLVLAAFGVLLGPPSIPSVAVGLGLLAGLATLPPTLDLLERWRCPPAIAFGAALGWMLTPRVVWSGVGGMETAAVACFMAWSLWAVEARRGGVLGASLASLVLTRPDGALWAVLLLATTWRRGRLWWRALPWAMPVVAWMAWAWWAFGTPIPHSIVAKAVVNPSARSLVGGAWVAKRLVWMSEAWRSPFPAVSGLGTVLTFAGASMAFRRPLAPVTAMFVVALPLALHLGRAPLFLWYPVPAAWASCLLGALATSALTERWRSDPRLWSWPLVVGLTGLVGLAAPARLTLEEQHNETMRAAVGTWLDEHAPSDAVVAMEAIGYQGTRANRHVIDLAGLVSPEVVAIARETPSNARRFSRILDRHTPWAVVLRAWEIDRNRHFHGGRLFENPASRLDFEAHYREATRFRAPFPERMRRNHTLVIYTRRREQP